MRIDSSGKVGVANTNPSAFNSLGATAQIVIGDSSSVSNLTMYSSSTGYGSLSFADSNSSNSSSQYSGLIQYYHSDNSMQFYTSATERMRITSGGDIQVTGGSFYNESSGITYIGKNSEYEFVDAQASTTKRFRPGVDDSFDLGDSSRRWNDIWATNPTIQTSDRNEKNTIKETDLGLDFINKLKPVSYKWNNKTRTHYGLIAQDVENLLSEINKDTKDFAGFIKADVSEEKDNTKHSYGLRYNEFISPMIKAIQEQQEIIQELKAEVDKLKQECKCKN
jgi:hypothetical protein